MYLSRVKAPDQRSDSVDLAELIAALAPHVGHRLTDPRIRSDLPEVTIETSASVMSFADVRGCDEFGVTTHFYGRNEFYYWPEIVAVSIGNVRTQLNTITDAAVARRHFAARKAGAA